MMRKLGCLFIVLCLLAGCAKEEVVQVSQETQEKSLSFKNKDQIYSLIIPFSESKVRLQHETRSIHREDSYEITKQLLALSSQYFNPSANYISEGQLLGQEQYASLLRYSSVENAHGLNPSSEQTFKTVNHREVIQPVLVWDLFEVNFYQEPSLESPLKGLSLALVLNREVTLPDGTKDEISREDMITYGENVARKLMSYLRNQSNLSQVPIFIGLYSLEKADSSIPGGFVSSAYFEGNTGQFTRSTQQWVILPSSQARNLIANVSAEFNILQAALRDLIPSEKVGVVGMARLIDNQVEQLNVVIHTTGKTYLEVVVLGQYAYEILKQRMTNLTFSVLLEVKVLGQTKLVIEKEGETITMVEW